MEEREIYIYFYHEQVPNEEILALVDKLVPQETNRCGCLGVSGKMSRSFFMKLLEERMKNGTVDFHFHAGGNGHNIVRIIRFPSTGVIELAAFIKEESTLSEADTAVKDFISCVSVISAYHRESAEKDHNDGESVTVHKAGEPRHKAPDPKTRPARTVSYEGFWVGCCYEMWFGKDYDEIIPLETFGSFGDCTLNETLANGTVHIVMYDDSHSFGSDEAFRRAAAFRAHAELDSAEVKALDKAKELKNEGGWFNSSIEKGHFPHGGCLLLKNYTDKNGQLTYKNQAAKVFISERGPDGKAVFQEIVELK